MRIWILGLLHSGTTVFWRAWRKDRRFLCFDEPLANLSGLPADCPKHTYEEFIQLFRRDPQLFWKHYAPMHPVQELDSSFTREQLAYLRFLLDQSETIVIDETHLHLHASALAELTPGAHVIHLHRRASGFATSHLRPSWSRDTTWIRRIVRRFRHEYNKRLFWTRRDYLPGMRRGDPIGHHHQSKFGLMLANAGYDAERILAAPTVVRLLAYWHFHYHYLNREGPRLFGDRFTTVRYEDFANDPTATMRRLYSWIGMEEPEGLRFSGVHRPRPPFQATSRRWQEAAEAAGFSAVEIDSLL